MTKPSFSYGIAGGTCLSMQRRQFDARFARRYFVGDGIDVGAGPDPLSNYAELFPLIRSVRAFDQPDGDAQKLEGIAAGSYDFLYSSHCLEHMLDPFEALSNWLRVVRPGGYLVIDVPDEDLYEQGQWPSTFNPDHKHSFTIAKRKSWSPVSINVCDMLTAVADRAKPISVMTVDHAYRMRAPRFDQTRTPLCESAIEIVLVRQFRNPEREEPTQ